MKKGIYKSVFFDASHRLMNYEGKCRRLHGHRWKVEIWCDGEMNSATGIIVDYNQIRDVVERFDHQVLLNEKDPLAECLSRFQPVITTAGDPSSEAIAILIHDMLEYELIKSGANARITKIRVWESSTCCAEIEYESV
ncbi:MAG: 6-carboxytetrahydropterin synthase [Methanomicrobiales archaeon]|nr:6-carboxytetrahydropterin synthase [Methanomicrobiales archaeon]